METAGKLTGASRTFDGKGIVLTFEVDSSAATQIENLRAQDKLRIKVVKWRERRSIDANNYMWELLSQMAPILHTSKDELYLVELQKYGTFMYLPGTDEDMENLSKVFASW